jgi:hypothetical protein
VWSAAPWLAVKQPLCGTRTHAGVPAAVVPTKRLLRAATAHGRGATRPGGTAGGSRSSHTSRSISGRPHTRTSGRFGIGLFCGAATSGGTRSGDLTRGRPVLITRLDNIALAPYAASDTVSNMTSDTVSGA